MKVVPVFARPDVKALLEMAEAVVAGRLAIPIAAKKPLKDAGEAHDLMTKGVNGKVLLVP